ncbi:MAG: permease [Candidatus Saelkia tenebricola]|nr:permease [Candidatus Saelkia tenebricola]
MNLVLDFINESISLWREVSPYLLVGMFIASLLHVFIGKEFIFNHLGRGGILSIIKATILGIPLPVCSCGVIPLANSLKKDGAHKSSVLSFLVSTPTTGIDSILATYSLMGPLFAIFRPLGAFISGILVGVTDYLFDSHPPEEKIILPHEHKKTKFHFKLKEQIKYAFFEIPQDIGKWLLIGTVLGGFISVVVPESLFTKYFTFPLDFIIVILFAVPLYVCATGSIPIAVALMAKGFTPGAALVFLIAGPATNAITLSFVRTKLGKRSFYIYLFSIITSAIILGVIFNIVWVFATHSNIMSASKEMLPANVKSVSALILFVLIINALLRKRNADFSFKPDLTIHVSDINCRDCKMILEESLKKLQGVDKIFIDVNKKTIYIKGLIDKSRVAEKIRECGYNPI